MHALLSRLRGPGLVGHLIALVAGALSTLSFAPYNIWPLGMLSVALLYQGLKDVTPKQAPCAVAPGGWGCSSPAFPGSISASTSTAMPHRRWPPC